MTLLIDAQAVSKQFGAVRALDNVSLEVRSGSIHALVGENGAGKSTLGKVISGVIRPDSGMLRIGGRPVRYLSPADAIADGITTITQEIALLGKQTVVENVLLGIEPTRGILLDRKRMRGRFHELLADTGFDIPPDARVESLRLADQKRVEVLQAIARDARVIVMDEPTAMLAADEAEAFRQVVRNLKDQGRTIVYVSHFLDEVLELADEVTVMRNGQVVYTRETDGVTSDELVTAMLGRSMANWFPKIPPVADDARVVFSARGVTSNIFKQGADLNVRAGEIVGIAGLVGSGRTRLARTLFGAEPRTGGEISVRGRKVNIKSPRDAILAGIHYVPESRKEQGLLLKQSLRMNLSAPHLHALSGPLGILAERRETTEIRRLLKDLDIRPPDPSAKVQALSGGNQQKALFGVWLFRRPEVLIVDEPTRGVDVGAKQAIYRLIAGLADEGIAILMISSEIEEILGLAHRVVVMREARIVAEYTRDPTGGELDEEAIMRAAFSGAQASPEPPKAGPPA